MELALSLKGGGPFYPFIIGRDNGVANLFKTTQLRARREGGAVSLSHQKPGDIHCDGGEFLSYMLNHPPHLAHHSASNPCNSSTSSFMAQSFKYLCKQHHMCAICPGVYVRKKQTLKGIKDSFSFSKKLSDVNFTCKVEV